MIEWKANPEFLGKCFLAFKDWKRYPIFLLNFYYAMPRNIPRLVDGEIECPNGR